MTWQASSGLPPPYVAAIEEIAAYWAGRPGADALLLAGSWARGRGDLALASDVDLILLHDECFPPAAPSTFAAWLAARRVRWNLERLGQFSALEFDPHAGRFAPQPRGWTSGPDSFELEIGNTLVYTLPIAVWTGRFEQLQAAWLPYYGEELRRERLAATLKYARNNLDHIPPYSRRGLLFQCLKRLHDAVEETLQALFIAARRYPIAYDKWVEEQVSGILGRLDLYALLAQVVTIPSLDAETLRAKARLLTSILDAELATT